MKTNKKATPGNVEPGEKRIVNVIGATGLVGKYLVQQLLADEHFQTVRIFVRRDSGVQHPKLEQHLVDFEDGHVWSKKLTGDVLFSCLGTTLKKAGGKENQYAIDYTFNLKFAEQAKANGIEHYVLVSSVGANAKSRLFYTRMKGELDEAVQKIGFKNLAILRPASLVGERKERRIAEEMSIPVVNFVTKFIFKKYKPIHGKTVAQAMINAVLHPNPEKIIWEADEVGSPL